MRNKFKEFDQYIEKLLYLQYKASEIIKHQGVKGQVRESFLVEQIQSNFPYVCITQGGELLNENGTEQSGELDIIFYRKNTRTLSMGKAKLVEIRDCTMYIEVKSNATHIDLKNFNRKIEEINQMCSENHRPTAGLFCYTISIKEENFIKKFGYKFDKELDAYVLDPTLNLQFPNIDFVICIDDENSKYFFLIKDQINKQYMLYKSPPVIQYFILFLKNRIDY
ncbi:TPA: DUF6602 domain-containing protein [Bacillus anthracis]|uniref:DUF6602 domain-containing protein n=1 Tax=Bacillus anthracis TaxID=1392 RepID=UPI0001DBF2BA|nr:DUF6602 domain-containing protein [Bacillus cereus]HDR6225724.1 hypothetical protein [Bacillus cereus biovar anthracis]ADK06910.1 hypothetical protein BACI_c43140 [Bacillus cereus biovar anthracis str. CI]HDR6232075.1 hypothetical protein [Bacillus cereus biovar anthracis]HDR6236761.1 hypothetical protein [Bacillus cereus biovar anthracis]HDR6250138.1 hypothetical protein [Bacillus cereus biovar anthracis]